MPRQSFDLRSNESRMAWIFGSSRSGSTWLARMLGGLDGVVTIGAQPRGRRYSSSRSPSRECRAVASVLASARCTARGSQASTQSFCARVTAV